MTFCIYEIHNLLSGMIYVGATCNPKARWYKHKRDAKSETLKQSDYIHHAMKKHGVESFEFRIVKEFETADDAFNAESVRIAELRSQGISLYNIHPGGNGCREVALDSRRERSERLKGKKLHEEIKKKISSTLQNRTLSEEHKRSISKGLSTDECISKRSMLMRGRLLTQEHKDAIASASKKRWEDEAYRCKMIDHQVGSKNSRSVLDEEVVSKIKTNWISDPPSTGFDVSEFYKRCATEHSVSPDLICKIIKGRLWKHIMPELNNEVSYRGKNELVPEKLKKKWLNDDFRERESSKRRGESNGMAILTENDVRTIRDEFKTIDTSVFGMKSRFYRSCASKFNVTPNLICGIVNNKCWKHVT